MLGSTSRFASPGQRAVRHQAAPVFRVERGVAVHLAVDLEPRRVALQQRERVAHLDADGWLLEPKLLCDSSAAFGCRPKRIISSAAITVISAELLGGRVVVHVRVDQHDLPSRQHQPVHAGVGLRASRLPMTWSM
jgi:hypothetical protein